MAGSSKRFADAPGRLRRDRYTLGLYLCFVTWGWFLYSFNPSLPLLRDQLGVSDWLAGLHGTAMAAGCMVAGALTPVAVRRLGRPTVMAAGGVMAALGATGLLVADQVAATLTAVLVTAVGGMTIIATGTVALVEHHPSASSAAVAEANGVGSAVGILAPLAVAVAVSAGWGWAVAVAVTVPFALLVVLVVARTVPRAGGGAVAAPGPARGVPATGARGWFLVCVLAGVGMEFTTAFWAVALVREQTAAPASVAAAVTAGFLVGMTAARFGIGLVSAWVPVPRLLAVAFVVAVVGWTLMWTTSIVPVALAGLVVMGAGIGLTYPLSVAQVLLSGAGGHDRSQGHINLASGVAIGLSPFLLGALADAFGTHTAFVLVPVLGVVGVLAAMAGGRRTRPGAVAA